MTEHLDNHSPLPSNLELYLDETRRYPLLTRQQEIDLGKTIRRGQIAFLKLKEVSAQPQNQLSQELVELISKYSQESLFSNSPLEKLKAGRLHLGLIKNPSADSLLTVVDKAKTAFDQMVASNLRLVPAVIDRHYPSLKMSKEDLIGSGNEGLLLAAARFDYKKGLRFSTFAGNWIWSFVGRAVGIHSHTIKIPRGPYRLARDYQRTSLGEHPDTQIHLNGKRKLIDALRAIALVSLDNPRGKKFADDNIKFVALSTTLADQTQDTEAEALEALTADELKQLIRKVLSTLSPQEQRALELRFGLVDGKQRKLQEVHLKPRVSRQRIHQIEGNAFAKLRQSPEAPMLREFIRY